MKAHGGQCTDSFYPRRRPREDKVSSSQGHPFVFTHCRIWRWPPWLNRNTCFYLSASPSTRRRKKRGLRPLIVPSCRWRYAGAGKLKWYGAKNKNRQYNHCPRARSAFFLIRTQRNTILLIRRQSWSDSFCWSENRFWVKVLLIRKQETADSTQW